MIHSGKEPPDGAAQQREGDKTKHYFQKDETDFERHIEHDAAGGHQDNLDRGRGQVGGDLSDVDHIIRVQ